MELLKHFEKHVKNSGRKSLLLVLDSNEYIFAFGNFRKESSKLLIDTLVETSDINSFRTSRFIINEVQNHLTGELFKEFILFIIQLTNIDEEFLIPFELGAKYENKGLKPADALIAAYTEWTGADVLVTENRHFLTRQKNLPFKILTATDCLKLIKSSHQ